MIRIPKGVVLDEKQKSINEKELRKFVISWNGQFPIDLWWRRLNEITFNSQQHRSICLLDVLVEIEERLSIKASIKEKQIKEANLVLGANKPLSEKELDNFDKLDFSKM